MGNYVYSIRNTLSDPKLEGKIPDDDKAAITKIVDEAIKWLDTNQTASTWDFEAKKKEVEGTVGPLLQKMAATAGGAGGGMPGGMPPGAGGMPGGMPPGGFPGAAAAAGAGAGGADAADVDDGPNIEEVD